MLYGYGGLNNAGIEIEGSGVSDFYDNALGGTMILRFDGYRYEAADFASDSDNFVRDGNNLVISVKSSDITINIEFGNEGSFTPVTESFWHSLA